MSDSVDLEDAGATITPGDVSAEVSEKVDDELLLRFILRILSISKIEGQLRLH
jgi:hypothetical protein